MTQKTEADAGGLRSALEGLVVVDFTQIAAGPTCTMLLADMGAEVIKIEPLEGELGRSLGPGWIGETSTMFHSVNRNKLGLSLDLKTVEGLAVAKRLIAGADILVESMRPGVMKRLGLGYDDLNDQFPRLIYCSISAYGQTGSHAFHAGVDGVLQADTGLMSLVGHAGSEPAKVQAPVVDAVTGYIACAGVLAKVTQRNRDGRGGHLDVSLMNSALALQQIPFTNYLATGELPTRMGSAAPYSAPNESFETSDGWIMVAAYSGNRWDRLCTVLGLPDLLALEQFSTSPKRVKNRAAMRAALSSAFRSQSTNHWLPLLRQADILCARVATYEDVERHAQVASNGMLISALNQDEIVRMPGFPINSAETNMKPHRAAPGLGQHSSEVLERFGFEPDEIERLVVRNIVVNGTSLLPRTSTKIE